MTAVAPPAPRPSPRALRRQRRGDLIARALLTAVWAYIVLPATLGALTGIDFHAVAEAALLAVTALSLVVVCVWFSSLFENSLWVVGSAIAPAAYVLLRELYAGHMDFHILSYGAITLAIAAARPSGHVLRVLVPLLLTTAIVAFALGVLNPAEALAHADGQAGRDKGLVPGVGLLAGMFDQENNLGQILALGLPVLLMVRDNRRRIAAVLVVVAPLVWSASRGSIITGIVDIALMVTLPRVRDRRLRSTLARTAVTICGGVCLWLPFVLRPGPGAFSARGGIWSTSIHVWWSHDRLFGMGATWYQQLLSNTASPIIASATHGHNQAVHWAVTGGLMLLVLGGLQWAIATYVLTAPRARYDVLGAVVMAGLCVNGWLEYDYGYVDGVLFWPFTFPVVATLLFARDGARRAVRRPLNGPLPEERVWAGPTL